MSTTTHLSIQNQLGSVEHYYHFLLGFLLPLVNYRYFIRADLGELLIRSCGIMDRHIQALAIPGLTIIPREKHTELAATRPGQLDYVRLEGFDSPLLHLPNELKRCRNKILLRLNRYNKRAGKTMPPAANPRILMINRLASDPFYQSDHCEIKTSGSDRRSIPNFNELTSSLSHFKPTIATLEQSSLKEQIDLLRGHDVIIAQHGAALANLVFFAGKAPA